MDFLTLEGVSSNTYSWQAFDSSRQAKRNQPEVLTGPDILRSMEADDGKGFAIDVTFGTKSLTTSLWPPSPDYPWQHFSISSDIQNLPIQNPAPLIEQLATQGRLGFGVVTEKNYATWQKCTNQQFYAAHFGSTEGFRIIRIPGEPPLPDSFKLDTSTNPGRNDKINGGPAMVAADMWLGPAFWKYAPCHKEEVISQPWLKVRDTEHFLHINSFPEPFTRPDGEQGEIQRKLWRLLFHSDCQWPPAHTQT